jgi:hypothetical protein
MKKFQRNLIGSALLAALLSSTASAALQRFDSPDMAMLSLAAAISNNNSKALQAMLGRDADSLLSSGDVVQDQQQRKQFGDAFNQAHHVDINGNRASLRLGNDNWVFPIPLLQINGEWVFDPHAGKDEILNRRVGRNERSTIEVMLAYVQAQRDYALLSREHRGSPQYAQRLVSSPGKFDGLYWPAQQSQVPSPIGPEMAAAQAEGYKVSQAGHPYHGYFYRILRAQGPAAKGGEREYVLGDRMIGGFALLAWPSSYGNSGVMTFMVNQDGVVYQRDLGHDTQKKAEAKRRFNPDKGWQPVKPE